MIKNCYLHTAYSRAMSGLQYFVQSDEEHLTQRAFFLVGPAGTGKSTLLESFFDTPAYECTETALGIEQPAIRVEAPSRGTAGALTEVILARLGDKNPQRGNVQAKMARMLHNLREQKVRFIVIDEVDQLTLTNAFAYADYLKSILNQSRTRLVLAGLETALSLPRANDQLARRCHAPQILSAFNWHNKQEKIEFSQILTEIRGEQPALFENCPIDEPTVAAAINYATDGSLGFVDSLLTCALETAHHDDGREYLLISDLKDACDAIYRLRATSQPRINPFREELPLGWREALPESIKRSKLPAHKHQGKSVSR
jgi:hypothetical protein